MRIWKLDTDGLEVLAIKRAVNHIAAERRTIQRVPMDFNVPVVPGGLHVLGSRKRIRRRFVFGRAFVDPDFIENERVSHAVWLALQENDVLQVLRLERINGCGAKFRERNADLNPAPGRQVTGEFSQRKRRGKASG